MSREEIFNRIGLAVQKIGTLLVDRRLWVAVVTVIVAGRGWLISDDMVQHLTGLIGQDGEKAVAYFEPLLAALTFLISAVALILGLTTRPPSGLDYKQPTITSVSISPTNEELDALIEARAGVRAVEMLQKNGLLDTSQSNINR